MTHNLKPVTIYTDGSCSPNPGVGGYGVVLLYDEHCRELSGGFQHTTNNRMEMMAAIMGLKALNQPCAVTLYSDSQYLVDSIMKGWVLKWRHKHWRKVKNVDLWKQLLSLTEDHQVEFRWVKGHAGNIQNERCDRLAAMASKQPNLLLDEGYGQKPTGSNPVCSNELLV
jgi:ribonuclease HI